MKGIAVQVILVQDLGVVWGAVLRGIAMETLGLIAEWRISGSPGWWQGENLHVRGDGKCHQVSVRLACVVVPNTPSF